MPCAAAAAASARLISPAAGVPPVMPVTISGARIARPSSVVEIDVGGGALGQRAVHQVNILQQRRAVEVGRARRRDRQVIGLALADAAVRH